MKRDLIILFAFLLLSAAPVWTPLVTDSTLSGIGTTDSPLSIDTTKIATRYYSGSLTGADYLEYSAVLSQSGTSDPTATVIKNTLGGTVVWTRAVTGAYLGTLTGAFAGNVVINQTVGVDAGYGLPSIYFVYIDSDDAIGVNTYSDYGSTASDGIMSGYTYIEVKVYP